MKEVRLPGAHFTVTGRREKAAAEELRNVLVDMLDCGYYDYNSIHEEAEEMRQEIADLYKVSIDGGLTY